MLLWLAAAASAAPVYVVDAWIVRTVRYDLMGIAWTSSRRPPGTHKEVRYCVVYGHLPLGDEPDVVAQEWIAVDGAGQVLSAEAFGASTGIRARKRGKSVLGGVQDAYSRTVAQEAEEVAAGAVTLRERAELRKRALAGLVAPRCSDTMPSPIG